MSHRPSRWWYSMLLVAAGVAGILIIRRNSEAAGSVGRIVKGTFARDRSGSPAAALGTASTPRPGRVQKLYMRTARRYSGPVPTPEELEAYRSKGQADAFCDLLLPEHRARVSEAVCEIESALDEIGDAIDVAIDQAKDQIRGTADEHRLSLEAMPVEQRKERSRAIRHDAQRAGDLVVSEGVAREEIHFRIRKDRFPDLFHLRQEDKKLTQVRQDILNEEVGRVLKTHGVAALDLESIRSRSKAAHSGALLGHDKSAGH